VAFFSFFAPPSAAEISGQGQQAPCAISLQRPAAVVFRYDFDSLLRPSSKGKEPI
jgi:hypothetical protein